MKKPIAITLGLLALFAFLWAGWPDPIVAQAKAAPAVNAECSDCMCLNYNDVVPGPPIALESVACGGNQWKLVKYKQQFSNCPTYPSNCFGGGCYKWTYVEEVLPCGSGTNRMGYILPELPSIAGCFGDDGAKAAMAKAAALYAPDK